jgi:protein SCO1/2
MSRTQTVLLAALVVIVAIAGGMFASRALLDRGADGAQASLVTGTLLEPARPLPVLDHIDDSGAVFDAARLKGRWSLLFFGFTSCPDVCPMTLTLLAQVEKSLADLPAEDRPHVVLMSVDPKRDTPQRLASYVKFFSPSFVGVTGSQSAVESFTRQLGVPVAIRSLDDGSYTVDHSATIFLINPNAELRAVFSTPHVPAEIVADYRRIVRLPT